MIIFIDRNFILPIKCYLCRVIKQLEIKLVSTIKDRKTWIKINYYAVVVGNHDEQ